MKITLANIEDVFKAKQCGTDTMTLKGYELIEELFCDSSGFGAPDELALTREQLLAKLRELLKIHGTLYATITGVGQFQVYIGLFKRSGKSKAIRVSTNVLQTQDTIRLYDTDILKWDSDHVTLNSGGFQTVTTKKWLNKYLPDNVYIYQKNFNWFVQDDRDKTTKEFFDGITIAS